MKIKTSIKAGQSKGITINHNETLVRENVQAKGVKVKSQVKAGKNGDALTVNHHETLLRANTQAKSLKVKSQVKAGVNCPAWGCGENHNETLVRDEA